MNIISEQEFNYIEKPDDLLKELYEKGSIQKNNNINIIIKYFGNKSQIPLNDPQKKWNNIEEEEDTNNPLSPDDPRNYLLFIKYENIYIGAISINNLFHRENFGLNNYSKDSFYIGCWRNNMKDGIGFLKINKDLMYIGKFESNQFNGFGILYDRSTQDLFFGEFTQGKYNEGVFYNNKSELFYRGKVIDGKKHDSFCSMFDSKNGYLFIGEIIDDEFNSGYMGYCQIKEMEEEDNLIFNVQKIFYFDGIGVNNKTFINHYAFTSEFYIQVQDIMNNIFQADFNIKDQNEGLMEYFDYLEGIQNSEEYNQCIENYNSFPNNNQSIENEFISNYYSYYQRYIKSQERLDLKEYENLIKKPEIKSEIDN